MKTLQNNFTTPEQSKRLLELGVPADSADCYLLRTHTQGDTFLPKILHGETYSELDKFTNMLEYLPCWSVGRLIEIMFVCTTKCSELTLTIGHFNIEYVLKIFEGAVKYDLDLSKLEE